eukprot:Rmarinus@m.15120
MEAKLRRGLECPVCYTMFDEKTYAPTALPCQHTFCASCIVKLLHKGPKTPCPMCSQSINTSKPEELKKNYAVLDVVRVLGQWMAREGPIKADAPLFCTECSNKGEMAAASYCSSCDVMLCAPHIQLHNTHPWTSKHVLVDIETVPPRKRRRLQKIQRPDTKNVLVCGKHPEERLRYYCPDCDELICLDCYNIRHKQHAVLEIDESLAEDRKKRLDELVKPLRAMFCNRDQEKPQGCKGPAFDVDFCLRMIDTAADSAIKEIQSRRTCLKALVCKETVAGVKAIQHHHQHLDLVCAAAENLCLHWEKARGKLTPAEVLV